VIRQPEKRKPRGSGRAEFGSFDRSMIGGLSIFYRPTHFEQTGCRSNKKRLRSEMRRSNQFGEKSRELPKRAFRGFSINATRTAALSEGNCLLSESQDI